MNDRIYLTRWEFLVLLFCFIVIGVTSAALIDSKIYSERVISGWKVKPTYETNSLGEVTLVKTEWVKP